jgi:hypothetical protein
MTLALVRTLATGATTPAIASAADLRGHPAAACSDPVERAAAGGLAATSLGWAFACGYEAALERLDPGATHEGRTLAALCATEEGGGHPRAIRTALRARDEGGWTLTGRKTWVTLGADADVLLVVASAGAGDDGRNRLRIARVPADRAGVRLEPGPPLPFAPDIGHARAAFDAVTVETPELLPGDGYDTYLKPFRTIEDVHVLAAALGWATRIARASRWERAWIDEAIALVVLLQGVAAMPPAPETHVALAGALSATRRLLAGAPWDRADAPTREGWERDRPLLDVASTVRAARREAAWRALDGEGH